MSKTARVVPLLAVLAFALPATASAAAGDLDPSFDGDGMRTLNYGGADAARAVMVQPDGRILVAGSGGAAQDFTLSRLHSDGSLDNAFAGDGTVVADFGGNDEGRAAALEPDGTIVVVGTTDSMSSTRMAVARFRPDGSPDASFDGDGKKTFGVGEQPASPTAIVLQPDGGIVVVGCCSDSGVTRLNANGSVDGTSFADADLSPNAVALQPDGKIVVAGDAVTSNSPPRMAVARYNRNGTLDDTFGGTRTFGAGDIVSAQAVLVQRDGRIVVAGYGNDDIDFVVTRLNSDGTFDTTFGPGGTSAIDFGLVEVAYAALLQPDGGIVVAGMAQPSLTDADFAAARLRPDGRLDATFGSDGRSTVKSGGLESAYAAALQPDGRIVLAGSMQVVTHDVAIARLEGVTPPPAGGRPSAGADRTAPILSRLSASPRRFRSGRRGTTLTVELSEPARVRFDVLAVSRGRRVGTRCRKPTRVNRRRQRCTLRTRAGGFSRSLAAGRSTVAFSGLALRPGRYTLRATPTDGAGNTGNRRAIALRIVRP